MSWKLFWQIVLLVVIIGVILSALKLGILQLKYGCMKGSFPGHMYKSMQK